MRFVVLRPLLLLDFDVFPEQLQAGEPPIGEYARISPAFQLSNDGGRFAEEVYIEIILHNWNTEASRAPAVNDGNYQGENSSSQSTDSHQGLDVTETVQVAGPAVVLDNNYKRERIDLPHTELDLKKSSVSEHPAASGEEWEILVDETVYPKDSGEFRFGQVKLRPGTTYTVTYRVACRTKRIRKGHIWIDVKEDGVNITESHNSPYYSTKKSLQRLRERLSDANKMLEQRVWY
jgi:hypothetical protein